MPTTSSLTRARRLLHIRASVIGERPAYTVEFRRGTFGMPMGPAFASMDGATELAVFLSEQLAAEFDLVAAADAGGF